MHILPQQPAISKSRLIMGFCILIDMIYILVKYSYLGKNLTIVDYLILGVFALIGFVFWLKIKPQDYKKL